MILLPPLIKIKYLNVQHFTKDKSAALTRHLLTDSPDIILLISLGKTKDNRIYIPGYNTFTVNKRDEIHAGSAIAIKIGIQFTIKNDFEYDTIGAQIMTNQGLIFGYDIFATQT